MILYRFLNVCGYRPVARALYRMEIAGAERIPEDGPCILVANHESVIDPFVLGLATPRIVRFMAKAELWRSSTVRAVMEGFGAFPVDRGKVHGSKNVSTRPSSPGGGGQQQQRQRE